MRKLALGAPQSDKDLAWAFNAIHQIELATYEDVEATMNDLTITGTFTPTRTLNAATATHADLLAFVATMVSDIQKRGQNRIGG